MIATYSARLLFRDVEKVSGTAMFDVTFLCTVPQQMKWTFWSDPAHSKDGFQSFDGRRWYRQ